MVLSYFLADSLRDHHNFRARTTPRRRKRRFKVAARKRRAIVARRDRSSQTFVRSFGGDVERVHSACLHDQTGEFTNLKFTKKPTI